MSKKWRIFISRVLVLMFIISFFSNVQMSSVDAEQTKSSFESISMISDKCIMLEFSDGYIQYHNYSKSIPEKTFVFPLNTGEAVNVQNYSIICEDDPDYAAGVSPISINRKTKSDGTDMQSNPNLMTMLERHFIYLNLEKPLKPNKEYKIIIDESNLNMQSAEIKIKTDGLSRTDVIHVNQLGYLPNDPVKFAYVSSWNGDGGAADLSYYEGKEFNLINTANNSIVYTGTITKYRDKSVADTVQGNLASQMYQRNFQVSDVYQCDFSAYTTGRGTNEFIISIPGIGCSYPFRISKIAYEEAYKTTTRGLYHQRMGIALEEQYTDWYRETAYDPKTTSFRVHYGSPTGTTVNMENYWGWYADAGDNDGYSQHMNVARYLMTIYECMPDNFKDNELNIPESGDGIPDILGEAAWLVNFGRRVRTCTPTGGVTLRVYNATLSEGEDVNDVEAMKAKDGGTPSGQIAEGASWTDTSTWWCVKENAVDTYIYAAAAAQYAVCLEIAGVSSSIIDEWKQEALEAYNWAKNEGTSADATQFMAASWIYRATRNQDAIDDVRAIYNKGTVEDTSSIKYALKEYSRSVPNDAEWGVFAFLHDNDEATSDLKQDFVDYITRSGEDQHNTTFGGAFFLKDGNSMRANIYEWMPQIIGTTTTPRVLHSILAYSVTKNKKYLNTIYTTCDYMLGGNQLNTVWVTGLGDNPVEQAFKIDEINKANDTSPNEFQPGIVPFGVNTQYMDDTMSYGGGCFGTGVMWNRSIYPSKDKWPMHEGWFNARYAILTAEYTVWQSLAPAASTYAFVNALAKDLPEEVEEEVVTSVPTATPTPTLGAPIIAEKTFAPEIPLSTVPPVKLGENVFKNGSFTDGLNEYTVPTRYYYTYQDANNKTVTKGHVWRDAFARKNDDGTYDIYTSQVVDGKNVFTKSTNPQQLGMTIEGSENLPNTYDQDGYDILRYSNDKYYVAFTNVEISLPTDQFFVTNGESADGDGKFMQFYTFEDYADWKSMTQPIEGLKPNTEYEFSFYHKGDMVGEINLTDWGIPAEQRPNIMIHDLKSNQLPDEEWTKYSIRFKTGVQPSYTFSIVNRSGPNRVTQFDAFRISEVKPYEVQVSEERFALNGAWFEKSYFKFSEAKAVRSSRRGDTIEAKFKGNKIELYGYKSPSQGKLRVFIDGIERETINMYRAAYDTAPVSIYNNENLEDGEHHLAIQVLEGQVTIDNVFAMDGDIRQFNKYSKCIQLEGTNGWEWVDNDSFVGNGAVLGSEEKNPEQLTFDTGDISKFKIFGYKSRTQGVFEVTTDGNISQRVNCYADSVDKDFVLVYEGGKTSTVKIGLVSGKVYIDYLEMIA